MARPNKYAFDEVARDGTFYQVVEDKKELTAYRTAVYLWAKRTGNRVKGNTEVRDDGTILVTFRLVDETPN